MSSKEELVMSHLRLAPYCVRRFLGRYRVPPALGLEMDDLVSESLVALCRAAEKWEPERGTFATYAGAAIHNWLLKVCRLNRGSLVDRVEFVSLYTPVGESGDDSLGDVLPDSGPLLDDQVCQSELRASLREAIAELPDRDRGIIQDLLGGSTVAGIARSYGCSRQRIDQIQSRAVRRLRCRLHTWGDTPAESACGV
jgi:RNA polymerase sigma factor (sigma-70 family)